MPESSQNLTQIHGMHKPPKLEVVSWYATITAAILAIASYFSFYSEGEESGRYTYKEIVACSAMAQVLNTAASEGLLFKPEYETEKRLNERMETITDSVIINSENFVNKMNLGDISAYKEDVHRYSVEVRKSILSGSTDNYKISLYLSTKCGSLNKSGVTLK